MEEKINIAEILSIEDLPNEVWKDIPSLKGRYQASNMGRIKRIASGKIREHILKQFRVGEYMSVGPSVNNVRVQRRVHRLVAMAFIPNPNRLPCINHKDENKLNNTVVNLEWCDVKYNCNYGTSIIRGSESRKNNKYSKKVEKVDKLGNIVAIYPSLKECKRNGYNVQIISQLCNHKCGCRYKTHKGYFWRFHKDNVGNESLLGTTKDVEG